MSLSEFAAEGGQKDVLGEILSRIPLTDILHMSFVSRDMRKRVLDLTAADFFWSNWVLNSLYPRHDPDLIKKMGGKNPWSYYARLHGLFDATELYSHDWSPSNDGKAGILDRFYPLYSSSEPLTVVRPAPGFGSSLIVLRGGELGFLSGWHLMDYKFESYPQHQIPGEKYVDFTIVPHHQGKELCLLTNRGKVYRLWTLERWKDATPLADIEGLWDDEIMVQIITRHTANTETLFLDRRGNAYQYNCEERKIISLDFPLPIARLTHSGDPIYFDNTLTSLQLIPRLCSHLHQDFLTNWTQEQQNNLYLCEVQGSIAKFTEAVRGISHGYMHLAWTVSGNLYTWKENTGLLRVSEIPDFVIGAHQHGQALVLALPRKRSTKLWEAIKDLDKDDIRTLLFSRMISKSFDDVDAAKQFLLREPEEEILPLIPHLKSLWILIQEFLTKPSKELTNLLIQHSIPKQKASNYNKPQAAATLAMFRIIPSLPGSQRALSHLHEVLDRETRARETRLRETLAAENVTSLRKQAANMRIKGRGKMRKHELINAIVAVLLPLELDIV